MTAPDDSPERVLVIAPLGRDSAVAAALLAEAGLQSAPCASVLRLVEELGRGAGCVVVVQEALRSVDLHPLSTWLADQPSWSDMPIIVITERGGGPERNPAALRLMAILGNVTLLERPFHPATLVSLAQSALRSRRRQYIARGQLFELETRERSLAQSEASFRTLAENIPVLTWSAHPDGEIFWYNSRWYEYTGTTEAQMRGWGWQSVHDPEALPGVLCAWRDALERGVAFDRVFPLRGADGVFRPFLTRAVPVFEDGRVVRWLGTNVDISAQRDAEAAIRASEEKLRVLNDTLAQQVDEQTAQLRISAARLRAVFETSYQAQGLLDVDGILLDANTTALGLIEAKLGEVVGRPFWDTPWFTATEGLSARVRTAVGEAAAGRSLRQEIEIEVVGGRRIFDMAMQPIHDETGAVVGILPEAAEITERRQAEEALRQAQKMEAVGQLTGGIAHDFNNMLQGIASGVELMQKRIDAGQPQAAKRYAEAVQQSIGRAAALTHRLLSFSRRQTLAPRTVEFDALVEGIVGLLRQTVGPSIAVVLEPRDGCWPVRCDANQLENALLNLAINARDAMLPEGGTLRLRTGHEQLDAAQLAGWSNAAPGEYVCLSMSDGGAGMSPEVLEHVFEPFYTTKPAGQGTGLGLSQVFGFISQSGGVMRIESVVGKGTVVHLYLPRDLARDAPATPPRPVQRRVALGHGTVLLVEDEAAIRGAAAEALRDRGCIVVEASDGPAGLKRLRALLAAGEPVDVLVADVGLPGGLNGRQLADAARDLAPLMPILLITGFAGEALGPGVQLGQHLELLRKPFALEALTTRVEAMLHGGGPAA
jgi:PAS domain S-box-containing protein